MTYPTTDNTFAVPADADRVHIDFGPLYSPGPASAPQAASPLDPGQWLRLIARLDQLPSPSVAAQPSTAAIPVMPGH